MPKFKYTAINRAGQHIDGQIDSSDMQTARLALSEQGKFVSDIILIQDAPSLAGNGQAEEQSGPSSLNELRLSRRDKYDFIDQFATALRAKVPVMEALEVVSQQNPNKRVVALVNALVRQIRAGVSLSAALSAMNHVFNRLDISLIKVGESSGNLDECMTRLSELNQRELEIRNSVITSSLYPLFVLFIGLLSSVVIITWIMPRIVFSLAVDIEWLPWPTRIMMNLGVFLNSPAGWVTISILAVAVLLFLRWGRTAPGRLLFDRVKLALPVVGELNRKWAVARFARMLGVLSINGVDLLTSLQVVRNCLDNEVLARSVDSLASQVRAGSTLSAPLRKSALFPALLVQVVAVGESTGKLPAMLINAADSFDKQTDQSVKRFMAIFPAILIFILAIIIGFLLMATLLPIVQVETSLPGF
ncbi:MAG: type II secretion system F family protein [Sedimentisphaerales bacterium]|nr:type II secretion system F family protein [Sedimentisphaerales bacterium]